MVASPLDNRAWNWRWARIRLVHFFMELPGHGYDETYGHKPFYVCRFADGRLEELLPIMEVSSPITGRRGVSLPFTDFCLPLSAGDGTFALYELALKLGRERHWKYLECRGSDGGWRGASPSLAFYGHLLDLQPGPDALFKGMGIRSVRRGIRKAEGQGLTLEFSVGLDAMRTFYGLHCRTRQRHGLPPQPFRFFANIATHVLGLGGGFVAW